MALCFALSQILVIAHKTSQKIQTSRCYPELRQISFAFVYSKKLQSSWLLLVVLMPFRVVCNVKMSHYFSYPEGRIIMVMLHEATCTKASSFVSQI